jgi:predicted kinase
MKERVPGARLIVICGLPGSGKTTLARDLEQRLGAIRFCPDEWMEALGLDVWDEGRRARIEALQWRFGQELLRRGLVVIIEWGTWGRAERDALREGARALGAAVELRYLEASEEVLLERIERRGMENPPITAEALAGWIEAFQAPTDEEMALYDPPVAVNPE